MHSLQKIVHLYLWLLLASAAYGNTVQTTVKYVSASGVYLDAGRTQGLAVGDTGTVRRGDETVARLEITFTADHSASCKVVGPPGAIHVGDAVTMFIRVATAVLPDTVERDTLAAPAPSSTTRSMRLKPRVNRVTGRIAVQYLEQESHSAANFDYAQPSMVLRLRVENLLDSRHTLNVRLRSRRTLQERHFASGRPHDWYNRVYEASLAYENPESRINYVAGRMLSNRLSGIGFLDGVRVDYRARRRVTLGVFGGLQPDQRTSEIATDVTKTGAYAAYEAGQYNSQRFSATLAAAGEYHRGAVSREFVYEQLDWNRGSILSVFHSAEIGVLRGWQKSQSGHTLELENLQFNARYAPVNRIAFTLGYDNRTAYRTFETRSLADSLFDTALQQGYRMGIDVRLPWALRTDVRGTVRTHGHDATRAQTLSFGLGTGNLMRQQIAVDARVNHYRNRYTTGGQISFSASRSVTSWWSAGAQAGRDRYDLRQSGQSFTTRWLRLSSDWRLTRHVYSSVYGELYRGEPFAGTRVLVELGWRF